MMTSSLGRPNTSMSLFSKESTRALPAPLDFTSLSSALLELGVGMRKAVETCLECWKVILEPPSLFRCCMLLGWLFGNRFCCPVTIFRINLIAWLEMMQNQRLSDEDLVSFLRSIKAQSSILTKLFRSQAPPVVLQVATADEMAELRALAGLGNTFPRPLQTSCAVPRIKLEQIKQEPSSPFFFQSYTSEAQIQAQTQAQCQLSAPQPMLQPKVESGQAAASLLRAPTRTRRSKVSLDVNKTCMCVCCTHL